MMDKLDLVPEAPRAEAFLPDRESAPVRPSEATEEERAKETQTDRAYRLLKEAVVQLRLKPGSAMNEALLCARFGLGRTPVNHALHRLSLDGLIDIQPRRGILIRSLSMEEFIADNAVRRMMEPACAAVTAQRRDERALERFETLLAHFNDVENFRSLWTAHRGFFDLIVETGCNAVLVRSMRGLHDRMHRFWAFAQSLGYRAHGIRREYAALFEAIRRQNGPDAAGIARRMIDVFESAILDVCKDRC